MAKFPPLLEAPVLKTIWHFPSVPAGSEGTFLRFRRPALFGLGFAELVRALPEVLDFLLMELSLPLDLLQVGLTRLLDL